jgi:hypothetical protein
MLSSVLLCACVTVAGATASVSDAFVVPLPTDSLAAWVAKNPTTIARAAGSQVVWRRGNQFAISRQTQRGIVTATMRDDIRKIPGGYQYACRLVPGSSEKLLAYELDCTLTAVNATTSRLTIRVTSSVAFMVPDRALERQMRQGLERVRELFTGIGR